MKDYKSAKDFEKPSPIDEAKQMMQTLGSLLPQQEHCYVCHKPLSMSEPYVEYYDKLRGVVHVCRDCTVRAVDYYIETVGSEPLVK